MSAWPGKTGSFGKSIVAVCDYEKQFFGAIIRCALGKLAGAFCSFLPSPIKRRPRRGLYKEMILKSFRFFYRSHYSLLHQRDEVFRRRRQFLVLFNISSLALSLIAKTRSCNYTQLIFMLSAAPDLNFRRKVTYCEHFFKSNF